MSGTIGLFNIGGFCNWYCLATATQPFANPKCMHDLILDKYLT